jgi:hypothetical protein
MPTVSVGRLAELFEPSEARDCRLPCAEPRSKGNITRLRGGPYVEGVAVGPKERKRRLAKQRVDRSHRRKGNRRGHRRPMWTRGEKAVLVLSFAFLFASMVLLGVVLPMA